MRTQTTAAALPCLATLFAGCASAPITADQAKPAANISGLQTPPAGPYGTFIVTRDRAVAFFGAGCSVIVSVDRQEVARLSDGETARFYHAPGEFIVSVKATPAMCPGSVNEAEVNLKEGATRRYRVSMAGGSTLLQPTAY